MVSDRARQFLPFDALKGFKEAIKEKEKIVTEKKELTEDEIQELSLKIAQIHKGMMLKVTYFCKDEYIVVEGICSSINHELQKLSVVKTKIDYEDIHEIESKELKEYF